MAAIAFWIRSGRRTISGVMLRRLLQLLRVKLPPGGEWDVGMAIAKRRRPESWVDTISPWWSHGRL
jgi:hypothetical protein